MIIPAEEEKKLDLLLKRFSGQDNLDRKEALRHVWTNGALFCHRQETKKPATLAALEQEAIREALMRNRGHRRRTAQELGIGLATLYRKLETYGELGRSNCCPHCGLEVAQTTTQVPSKEKVNL